MKINETIRERRLAKNMTQEQMAAALGVTASAVNKWEKGTSCPDIAILPPLARLLGIDLNTLFSFQQEMNVQEIGLFLGQLEKIRKGEGWERACEAVWEKLREYPGCEMLILNTALWLDGAVLMYGEKDSQQLAARTEELYRKIMDSPDEQIRSQARSMLIARYMGEEKYEEAGELIESLPDASGVDKDQLRINLYISQGKFAEAARAEEEKLLRAASGLQSILLGLMEIALKENRMQDAAFLREDEDGEDRIG